MAYGDPPPPPPVLITAEPAEVISLAVVVLRALADGRITSDEWQEIAASASDLLDTSPAEGLALVVDLLQRDPDKIRERADEAEANGDHDKAAKLRARADRVEGRQD